MTYSIYAFFLWFKKSQTLFILYWLDIRMGRGGRVVECTGLENRQAFAGLVSSNLTLSARIGNYYKRPFVLGHPA